ncbi:MAG: hypothetical protein J6Y64_08020 [Ruminococcus sp.]|nr:hypothetical protein [Ruminococcus sp.]
MKKRSPTKTAWLSVLIMLVGVVIGLCSLCFLNNKALAILIIILAIAVFVAGLIVNFVFVRCPHCGSHPGRISGPKCPHCGKDLEQ